MKGELRLRALQHDERRPPRSGGGARAHAGRRGARGLRRARASRRRRDPHEALLGRRSRSRRGAPRRARLRAAPRLRPQAEPGEFYAIDVVGAEVEARRRARRRRRRAHHVSERRGRCSSTPTTARATGRSRSPRCSSARSTCPASVVELVTLDDIERMPRRRRSRRRTDDPKAPSEGSLVRVDVVTLFPELFETFLKTSFVGRAMTGGQLSVRLRSPARLRARQAQERRRHALRRRQRHGHARRRAGRVHGVARRRGRGRGRASRAPRPAHAAGSAVRAADRGALLDATPAIMLICGRYEGFDERVRGFVDEELSLGDFVMTGGEVAAMAVIEASVRLIPGVLGNEESTREESHGEGGLLEYPQYTRPAEFRGQAVPEVLASGNHAQIAKWRSAQSLARTRARRPDLAPASRPHRAASDARREADEPPARDRARAPPGPRREGAIVTTALTNLDVHDLARSARTYGCTDYFIVHPIEAQRELAKRIVEHWTRRLERQAHPRSQGRALDRARRPDARGRGEARSGARPTSRCGSRPRASLRQPTLAFAAARARLEARRRPPVLLVFGTGWGLAPEVVDRARRACSSRSAAPGDVEPPQRARGVRDRARSPPLAALKPSMRASGFAGQCASTRLERMAGSVGRRLDERRLDLEAARFAGGALDEDDARLVLRAARARREDASARGRARAARRGASSPRSPGTRRTRALADRRAAARRRGTPRASRSVPGARRSGQRARDPARRTADCTRRDRRRPQARPVDVARRRRARPRCARSSRSHAAFASASFASAGSISIIVTCSAAPRCRSESPTRADARAEVERGVRTARAAGHRARPPRTREEHARRR